jgi:MYXO-CTERM domain-containing protein
VDGKEAGLLFGTGLAIGDLNQDGFNELFVGAPGWATNIGMIFMYDRATSGPADQTDALNTWIGRFQEILGIGAGVEIITVAGSAYLVSTACDFAGDTLATSCTEPAGMSAAIWESSTFSSPTNITGSLWNTSHMSATIGPIHRVPGEDALIVPGYPITARWDMSTPSSPYVAGPVVNASSAAAAPVGVNPNTGNSGAILRHGDDVSRVEDFSTVQPIADVAVVTYTVSGEVLGQQIAPVADWDGDGCDDALVSSEGGEAIWLIPCPALPVDTGDTGDSDTDTGDSDTDTGDSDTDTGDSDSDSDSVPESDSVVDSADSDTGPPVVCEPEFGWTCSGGGSTGAALMLLGLGVLARRRRRQG